MLILDICVCLCVSPGDRITVLDDSNEEWWRVSRLYMSEAHVCVCVCRGFP